MFQETPLVGIGLEFVVTFVVGVGVFAIAVLPEPELQQWKRLVVVTISFAGVGLLGYLLNQIVFTALGAATIPALTLYYRTKDQHKRIEKLGTKNAELTEAVQKTEETNTTLMESIAHLRDDKTDLRDHNATYLQALMDVARDDLVSCVNSLWQFYRLELVEAVTSPFDESKIHRTRMVVIFSLIKMMLISYCKTEDQLTKVLDGMGVSSQMKRKIMTQYKQVRGEFED